MTHYPNCNYLSFHLICNDKIYLFCWSACKFIAPCIVQGNYLVPFCKALIFFSLEAGFQGKVWAFSFYHPALEYSRLNNKKVAHSISISFLPSFIEHCGFKMLRDANFEIETKNRWMILFTQH